MIANDAAGELLRASLTWPLAAGNSSDWQLGRMDSRTVGTRISAEVSLVE